MVSRQNLQNETDTVSLAELKEKARGMLPRNSMLLSLILSEPDTLPRMIALAKVEVFAKLLREELDRR